MTDPQVLIDPRGTAPAELVTGVRTILREVQSVELVHPDLEQVVLLEEAFPGRVTRALALRPAVPVLVVPGGVALARRAVGRILSDLATPGRALTAVLVPGERMRRVACWSPAWLSGFPGTLEDLVGADLAFDRSHLAHGSTTARSWLRADSVGVAQARDVGDRPMAWALMTGVRLSGEAGVARLRAPLGVVRRRVARRRQRRQQAARLKHVR